MPREAPYLAVADALRARILAGEWGIGERLPSRAQLAEEYGAGRNVMQRAVDGLIINGLLEGRAGSGTYVRIPRERLRMVRSRHRERRGGFPSRACTKERGKAGAWDSHSQARVPAPDAIAERLAISPGRPLREHALRVPRRRATRPALRILGADGHHGRNADRHA